VAWRDTDDGGGEKSELLQDDIIGVAVLAWRPAEGRIGRKGRRVGRAWIRGWAVSFPGMEGEVL